jgi:hypothetical protein
VRQGAATALGQIGDPEAVPHLITALSDSDDSVRQGAATALGRIGDPEAVPHLITALSDSDDSVRQGAATALGRIGDPEAVPHLITALSDSNDSVRQGAATALGQLANMCSDSEKLKKIAGKLWWRLTDVDHVKESAYDALDKVAIQQSRLEVEGLPFDDPLIPTPVKPRSEWLLTLYILIAILLTVSLIISNILIEQLKQQGLGFKIFILIVAVIIVAALIGVLKLLVKRIEEEKQKVAKK